MLIEDQVVLQVLGIPLSTIKALFLAKNIDYYCFSYDDFKKSDASLVHAGYTSIV